MAVVKVGVNLTSIRVAVCCALYLSPQTGWKSEMSSKENETNQTEPSLLIVDDAQMMRLKIERLARAAGWKRIAHAADGGDAVELYSEDPFTLVTMDIVMPGIDGLEALTRIRRIDPDARVVMVSAINQKSKLSACIDAGAVDFIVKPFDAVRFEKFLADRYQTAVDDLVANNDG
jgi:two-component system chemotaxis response regulator CheY